MKTWGEKITPDLKQSRIGDQVCIMADIVINFPLAHEVNVQDKVEHKFFKCWLSRQFLSTWKIGVGSDILVPSLKSDNY